ncbi:MAG TPA: right-handed parallel beta-helix repeat-containing protein [Nitrososphaeraceae archaeon]|nr:right-handed parallel beta-helix repeat-containing protein [Nitrososphaeraceae archaeon]
MKFISDRGSKKRRRLTLVPTVGLLLSATMLVVVAVVIIISISALLLPLSYGQQQNAIDSPAPCITYDSTDKIITITCDSARLTDIDNQIKDANILHKETAAGDGGDDHGGVWLLNAGIVVAEGATLYINSTDTIWLKIIPDDETTANGIEVYGSLKIDSVKITSWNPATNDYVKFKVKKIPPDEGEEAPYDKIPRPFIRVEHGATGTTDITNSELAYLGYEVTEAGGGGSGLNYYGGDGSIIRGNQIHDNRFGFYSAGVGGIILEDNHVYDNYMYGFDPHTATHDMIIRNNTVHDSGTMGIICSLDCYNITIEDNEVYNSFGSGIMFSRNMYNSVARNNYVHDETQCIFVSESNNNEIYNNKVSYCSNGIYLKAESSNNNVYDNTIINATSNGILVNTGSSDNTFTSNTIINATELGINVEDSDSVNNRFENNNLINSKAAEEEEEEEEDD